MAVAADGRTDWAAAASVALPVPLTNPHPYLSSEASVVGLGGIATRLEPRWPCCDRFEPGGLHSASAGRRERDVQVRRDQLIAGVATCSSSPAALSGWPLS